MTIEQLQWRVQELENKEERRTLAHSDSSQQQQETLLEQQYRQLTVVRHPFIFEWKMNSYGSKLQRYAELEEQMHEMDSVYQSTIEELKKVEKMHVQELADCKAKNLALIEQVHKELHSC